MSNTTSIYFPQYNEIKKLGFEMFYDKETDRTYWTQKIANGNTIRFTLLEPQHIKAQGKSQQSAYDIVIEMQKAVFNIVNLQEVIPSHVLSLLQDTGGAVIIADTGILSKKTWVGFSISFGGKGRTLLLKSMGVNKKYRGYGIGQSLYLLQAFIAKQKGYSNIQWTIDPLRGINASIFSHLGAKVVKFTEEFYGKNIYSNTKGKTDRLTIHYDIRNLKKVIARKKYSSPQLLKMPIVGNKKNDTISVKEVLQMLPPMTLYEIPYNVVNLNTPAYQLWKNDIEAVFGELLDSEKYIPLNTHNTDLVNIKKQVKKGKYIISDFITVDKRNFYVLMLKPHK